MELNKNEFLGNRSCNYLVYQSLFWSLPSAYTMDTPNVYNFTGWDVLKDVESPSEPPNGS